MNRIAVSFALVLLPACTCDKSAPASASATPSAAVAEPAPSQVASAHFPTELTAPSSWPVPSGLRLAVLAGKGVGPIRFGATVETIERHMQLPCDVRTPDACRYIGRAIEFSLKDGVAVEMHLHRRDRSAGPGGDVYGVFNGRTPEGVAFFMLPAAVTELIGPPKKVEQVKDPGPWGMVEVHEYPGMRLEFDRIANGNVVLGGIVLTKADVK